MARLFCFGIGFTAQALLRQVLPAGWAVTGTARTADKCAALEAEGLRMVRFDGTAPLPPGSLDGVTHVLVSVPPGADGDPVLRLHGADIAALPGLEWVGYLSTTGVYGDRGGAWVDEDTPIAPDLERSVRRAEAERGWLALGAATGAPVQVFRLAGIYGRGRSALDNLRAGTAQRIVKPGQVFCRIHVDDIAQVLRASMARPNPGRIYNVADDEPAPPQDVITYAAGLLGIAPPPEVPFEQAPLSPMARTFYQDSKRVKNRRIREELGVRLKYPTYREGLQALL
ncbi:SDR family oxidoreductase [Novispirillum sp. DQ9]|uniref:SDR family oxidoreductase n=1 Tax=Novispirillum sp. DQ9 TaxID=3398612 RepID=UPI003C7DB6C3